MWVNTPDYEPERQHPEFDDYYEEFLYSGAGPEEYWGYNPDQDSKDDSGLDEECEDCHEDQANMENYPKEHNSLHGRAVTIDNASRTAPKRNIILNRKIDSANKGYAMLTKLGWSPGQPLGNSGDGACEVNLPRGGFLNAFNYRAS